MLTRINFSQMRGPSISSVGHVLVVVLCLFMFAATSQVLADNTIISGHQKMLALLAEINVRAAHENTYLGDTRARGLRDQLKNLGPTSSDTQRLELHFQLGEAELMLGNEGAAIQQLSAAYRLLPKLKNLLMPESVNGLIFRLGVAYMRLGETQNCCLRYSPDSCILPIRGGGVHSEQEGSRKAIGYFMEVLGNSGKRSRLHLEAQWLLNIAYMTIGDYPEDVPPAHLIPPGAFESEEDFPRFTNIASKLGLATFSLSGGAVADDFNSDGYLDLLVSTWDTAGQIRLFINNQDGSFSDDTVNAGLTGIYGGLNLVHADYDNDGDVDVLVLRGAWLTPVRYPNSLLRNNGDGVFQDVTFESGLGEVHYPSQTAAWADYDNDGNLDLFVGNEALGEAQFPGQLFHNEGDGTFVDVAHQAGVAPGGYVKAVVWGDYDGDRFPDLYVSNLLGPNRLYRNNRDGTFSDQAVALGVDGPQTSFPAWFWDFDNDGVLDLFVSAYSAGIDTLARGCLGYPVADKHLARLYRGDGKGGFEQVGRQYNLNQPTTPMGSNFGDLDNDGYLDCYLGTGGPDYKYLMPNVMYRNQAGKAFVDITAAAGMGHLQKGHAVIFADFDNDGDQDVFEQMGGAFPGDKFNDAFYENPGFGHHWISVELVGVSSNRSAIGARIRIEVLQDGKMRSIYKHVNSGGTFGGNPLRQTVGLGQCTTIKRLEVFWPTTGGTQVFTDVPMNGFIRIVEGEDRYTLQSLKTYGLGRPAF